MDHKKDRAELRGAVYRGDAESLVSLLKAEAWPNHALQLIGDGLLGVLPARTDGIEAPARQCVTALRERDWEGDDDRWLWVESEGSRAGYHDMELFIAAVEDPDQAARLGIAIEGRGAFRRFKDVLSRWPDLLDQWYAFSEDRQRGGAREWLAAEGYAPAPRRPRA